MGVAPSWFWDGNAGLPKLAAANHFGRGLNPEAIKCISKAGFFFFFEILCQLLFMEKKILSMGTVFNFFVFGAYLYIMH